MYKIKLLLFIIFPTILCDDRFPDGFLFGVASSAYQIEGGHDAEGKGESIWDYHLRVNPSLVEDLSNGNIACDSYNQYREDLGMVEALGVDFYRFSISWTRILPSGYPNRINSDGIRYYNELIDGLVARNIQPMVTMYHWDIPKRLQDLGGWTNPIVIEYFRAYARILFENFGDRVKLWITFNNSWMGYRDHFFPPLINQSGIADYLYTKNVLVAHAKVYRLYQDQFKKNQNGLVGITIDGRWYEPASASFEDQEAAERVRQFCIGIIANPIFGTGDYPKSVKERVDDLSRKEGFVQSRLPELTEQEIDLIKGSFDFFGLNIYTTFLVKNVETSDDGEPSFHKDIKAALFQDPKWPKSHAPWLKVVPWGFRKILNWLKENYNNPLIFVTENGFSDNGELDDIGRINYMELYLGALLEAIHEDGVQVKGYAAWSLMDNFEWTSGYSEKFGLYQVDFSDPKRPRTAKSSAKWYRELVKRRKLNATTSFKIEL